MNYTDSDKQRLLSKIVAGGNGCWVFGGWRTTKGYGCLAFPEKPLMAHRVSYEIFVGPIPEGLTLDHLCRNRACVRPDHLEPVTHRVNILRGEGLAAKNAAKTHCPAGHAYADYAVMLKDKYPRRDCLLCKRERGREYMRARRAALRAQGLSVRGNPLPQKEVAGVV